MVLVALVLMILLLIAKAIIKRNIPRYIKINISTGIAVYQGQPLRLLRMLYVCKCYCRAAPAYAV